MVADRGVEAMREIAGDLCSFKSKNPVICTIQSPIGESVVYFLSADNPENIRSFGFRGIVVDEAALVPYLVWTSILRPTLSDTQGWAVWMGTPRGRNWFFDMFSRGNDPLEDRYASFHFESRDNPYFPKGEWDQAKRELPTDIFRQEYEAAFLEDSAGVFRGVDKCLVPPDTPMPRGGPVVGRMRPGEAHGLHRARRDARPHGPGA